MPEQHRLSKIQYIGLHKKAVDLRVNEPNLA